MHPTFLILSSLLPTALSVTTLHYYKIPSCNTGTDVGSYDAPITPTANDTTCHAVISTTSATSNVRALYVNGLDSDCAVIAYTTSTCDDTTSSIPKFANKGDCFYLDSSAIISGWKAVCGSALAQAKAGSASASASSSASGSTNGTASATAASTSASATTVAKNGAERNSMGVGMGVGLVVGVLGWVAL